MHQQTSSRLTELQAEIEQLRAQLRLRERQLFGRKAEPAPTPHARPGYRYLFSRRTTTPPWPTTPGPGPVRHAVTTTIYPLSLRNSGTAGRPATVSELRPALRPFPEHRTDSELLEIEESVPYRRRLSPAPLSPHLHVAAATPGIVSARRSRPNSSPKVSSGSVHLGDPVAGQVCLRPAHAAAVRRPRQSRPGPVGLGTLTDGFQRLVPLFQPLYEALVEHQEPPDGSLACR